ncbi:acyl-CoA dehydrogenase family protein [Croceicoccus sediminis]|uniref:acyl-CoA dehydrogenase family protein n=1 Tax=Croceicoccus sediminis TaxID=2571150 RepID=UPI0011831B09|nr:acyl-CoA dehydrogenase family protein [Croceicoccus sediminis]
MDAATAGSVMTNQEREAALDKLFAMLPERQAEMTEKQRLPAEIVALLRKAGIYRMLVAKQFGGDQASPADFLRLIERIASHDPSTGWVASFGFSAIYLSALPVASLEKMYANGPDVIFAGGIFPPQPTEAVDGGIKVNGRWSWGSGSTGADYIGVGIKAPDGGETGGLPLIAVMPAEKARIEDNWDVNGLKATGSHDMVVEDVVVPREWTFIRGGKSSLSEPLYRYPSMALAAQVLAIVAIGAARGAMDALIAKASGRKSITGAPTFAQRAHVQSGLAKAEAKWNAARAWFYDVTESSYRTLCEGGELDQQARVALRLAASHAAHTGAEVCLDIYRMMGTDGIFTDSPVGRFLQDALIVPQHAFLSEGTYESAGRCMLGLDAAPGFP